MVLQMDIERLITLVKERPALWDKSKPDYKNRTQTRSVWTEVCEGLDQDFTSWEDLKKEDFRKL